MWSNVISIDKRYDREISYILESIENTNDISYATEESRDRLFVYLASACEDAQTVESKVQNIAGTVIIDFFKLRFFLERLTFAGMSLAECALLSAIVHFDSDFERAVCQKAFSTSSDFNIDGVFRFRLNELAENWKELSEVASRLLCGVTCENELFDIASFITGSDGGKNQLLIERGRLKNITCHKTVEVVNLFDRAEFNLLSAIMGERPLEIHVRHGELSSPLCSTLRRIARVIEK